MTLYLAQDGYSTKITILTKKPDNNYPVFLLCNALMLTDVSKWNTFSKLLVGLYLAFCL